MPMMMKGPDGQSIMNLDDWLPDHSTVASVKSAFLNIVAIADRSTVLDDSSDSSASTSVGGQQIYVWQDEKGKLHYGDTAVDGATVLSVNSNTLSMPSENFVSDPATAAHTSSSDSRGVSQAVLLQRRGGDAKSGKKLNYKDIEAVLNGDLKNAGSVVKQLPDILNQINADRQKMLDSKI